VPKRPGDKGRTARLVLKARTVTIKRPNSTPDRQDATKLTLEAAPARVEPLLWRLLTTLPVATRAHALEVVRLYRLRWRIEEVFRILKSNGLRIEDSQFETADRLFNLAAFGLVAAARIIQLVDARDGSTRPATDVIEADDIKAAAAISATLEGGTRYADFSDALLALMDRCTARRLTISHQAPRPWPAASIASSTVSKALGLLTSVGMCESRRAAAGAFGVNVAMRKRLPC
jgi:Transposase DDE domain